MPRIDRHSHFRRSSRAECRIATDALNRNPLAKKTRFRHGLLDFPMRPQTGSVWGERGISRFRCEMFPYHS
jgi:hypothetical protein